MHSETEDVSLQMTRYAMQVVFLVSEEQQTAQLEEVGPTRLGECVVRCIGSEARFLWVYTAPTVMQLWYQRSENFHF